MTDLQKETIVTNIKKYLKENDMTQSELASQIGIARSTLSDYMNYRAKPSSGVLEKMAAVFGVTKADIDTTYKNKKAAIVDGVLQLISEEGNIIDGNTTTTSLIAANQLGLLQTEKEIPVIGKIAAGTPIEAVQDIVDRIVPPYKTNNTDELFGLVVNGESMNKIVPNGHYAVLKKQPDVENGEIAAVIVNGHYATLKKVYKFTDLMVLEPCSHDESFKDQQFSRDNCEDIKIIGKFLYSVSPIIQ
ncbi:MULTISPECIES: LexA family protein [Bacillus]|uniref:LexA family protein n=1 Tax=Bacillus TaxID=1386 RepID=UPI001CBCB5EF|nr:LexA family transcriptional regulator [Bacillus wiedmannii]MBZ4221900.1 helix-turn-helix domain-containing protein [Bacillus wiedmannii]MCC2379603.1 helix-turn-helix domain-containing protein [Bacillus wiedmannii]MCC2423697.1 helix-turn-helix domain-containing protein [Bacillus wiedmannii]MCU5094949.1 helix-turn-helix domain-containing protein [Bacillus wiedmannii]